LAPAARERMLATVDTISVWRFGEVQSAEQVLRQVRGIDDAALVWWPAGRRMPSTRHVGAADLWWGVLLGMIFLAPFAGPALGAAAGAVAGGLADFGLGDDFILQVREAVTPGTSAVFVMSDRATAAQLELELGAPLIRAELSYALTEIS
jgi:uncharacterized membrane protein